MRTWIVILLLALPVYGQERMKSSRGWHVEGSGLRGPRLTDPIIQGDGVIWRESFDTSRVFIERLDTTRADTCRECPAGFDAAEWPSGDSICLKRVISERRQWWECEPPQPPQYDTTWQVRSIVSVVKPTAIDTTWRLIPDGFDKAEWMRLWIVMHPAPVKVIDLIDTLMIWRAVPDVYMDSARVDRFLLQDATIVGVDTIEISR